MSIRINVYTAYIKVYTVNCILLCMLICIPLYTYYILVGVVVVTLTFIRGYSFSVQEATYSLSRTWLASCRSEVSRCIYLLVVFKLACPNHVLTLIGSML